MAKIVNNKVLYQHLKPSGEIFYIGIGTEQRANSPKGRNQLWERVVNKYGYEVEILERGLTWEEACEREIELISFYGRINNKTGILVNMTDGGEGVNNPSKESRAKMSKAKLGKAPWNKGIKTNHIPWNKGKTGYMGANRTSFHSGQIPWNKGMRSEKVKDKPQHKSQQFGEAIGTSKLKEHQILEIRNKFKPRVYTRKMLSEEYGVSEATIKDIVLRKSWKHLK